jgi:hypothetical protein
VTGDDKKLAAHRHQHLSGGPRRSAFVRSQDERDL